MDKFNFRLQKVLDIRHDMEEQSKLAFKEAQNDTLKVKNRLNSLEDNYKKYSKIGPNCSAIDRKIRQNYCSVVAFNINETKIDLEKKKRILEEKRQDLRQKQMDRKTVEILKDKQKDAYIKEQNLIEQKSNDEFALYSYMRKAK